MTDEQRAADLVAKWEHGDEKHRQWLRDIAIPDLEAAFAEVRLEPKWLPIESAPKDCLIDILIAGKTRWCDCYYDNLFDEWRTSKPSCHIIFVSARAVTHWMLAPKTPQ